MIKKILLGLLALLCLKDVLEVVPVYLFCTLFLVDYLSMGERYLDFLIKIVKTMTVKSVVIVMVFTIMTYSEKETLNMLAGLSLKLEVIVLFGFISLLLLVDKLGGVWISLNYPGWHVDRYLALTFWSKGKYSILGMLWYVSVFFHSLVKFVKINFVMLVVVSQQITAPTPKYTSIPPLIAIVIALMFQELENAKNEWRINYIENNQLVTLENGEKVKKGQLKTGDIIKVTKTIKMPTGTKGIHQGKKKMPFNAKAATGESINYYEPNDILEAGVLVHKSHTSDFVLVKVVDPNTNSNKVSLSTYLERCIEDTMNSQSAILVVFTLLLSILQSLFQGVVPSISSDTIEFFVLMNVVVPSALPLLLRIQSTWMVRMNKDLGIEGGDETELFAIVEHLLNMPPVFTDKTGTLTQNWKTNGIYNLYNKTVSQINQIRMVLAVLNVEDRQEEEDMFIKEIIKSDEYKVKKKLIKTDNGCEYITLQWKTTGGKQQSITVKRRWAGLQNDKSRGVIAAFFNEDDEKWWIVNQKAVTDDELPNNLKSFMKKQSGIPRFWKLVTCPIVGVPTFPFYNSSDEAYNLVKNKEWEFGFIPLLFNKLRSGVKDLLIKKHFGTFGIITGDSKANAMRVGIKLGMSSSFETIEKWEGNPHIPLLVNGKSLEDLKWLSEKADLIEKLGMNMICYNTTTENKGKIVSCFPGCIAVGDGENDKDMLEKAALGIGLPDEKGSYDGVESRVQGGQNFWDTFFRKEIVATRIRYQQVYQRTCMFLTFKHATTFGLNLAFAIFTIVSSGTGFYEPYSNKWYSLFLLTTFALTLLLPTLSLFEKEPKIYKYSPWSTFSYALTSFMIFFGLVLFEYMIHDDFWGDCSNIIEHIANKTLFVIVILMVVAGIWNLRKF